jgi:hypothetical protein
MGEEILCRRFARFLMGPPLEAHRLRPRAAALRLHLRDPKDSASRARPFLRRPNRLRRSFLFEPVGETD